jgi:Helicase conserved C-terminal domain
VTSTLARWLAERSRDELAAILARRPETLGARHLGEVASRLSVPYGIETVLRDLPKPCIELLETIAVYGGAGLDVDDLASLLGVDSDDRLFAATLDVCQWWAVAWVVDGDVHVAPALTAALPRPLHLGPSVADLLAPRAVDDLRTRATVLGLNPTARKHDLVAAIAGFYRDADAVRALYAAAPSAQRERLAEAAWRGPALDYSGSFFYTGRPDPAIAWLLAHGLVIADWQQIVVPREVALAIRGDDWHPTLTPRPDVETTDGVAIDVVDDDAAAAAALATEHVTLVVDACELTPPTLLKTGGVGVRDLRRLAKVTALPEPAVRLWLTLAIDVGLLDVDEDGLVPTAGYDAWLAEPPAQRLAVLADAWWDLRTVPTLVDRPDESPPRPVLADDAYATVAADLRRDLLSAATAIPPGRAVPDGLGLAAAVEWRRPAMAQLLSDVRYAVTALWVEAHLLGVAARGTLSTLGWAVLGPLHGPALHGPLDGPARQGPLLGPALLGPALLGPALHSPAVFGDRADDTPIEPLPPEAPLRITDDAERLARLSETAAGMLPEHTYDAIFQADLTIVVTGTPAADLAALLDGSADRESRGGAATWRFSADSVRRALDAGHTGETLTAALRAVAVAGQLPQPLEYLITDAARRHGGIRVRAVGCVLRADDSALLAELVGARSLRSLQLTELAPNVLGSALDAAATLRALRAAGYAPVGEAADGHPLVERIVKRRASARATVIPIQSRRRPPSLADPYDRADALMSTPVPEAPKQPALRLVSSPTAASTATLVDRYASHLTAPERQLLCATIDAGRPVTITYTSGSGEVSERVIEPIELTGGVLVAWCQLRDDERKFALARIGSVVRLP